MSFAGLLGRRARARGLLLLAASAASSPAFAAETAQAPVPPERNFCTESAGAVALGAVQWNGWGRDLENTRYQPEPALRASDVPKLAVKWAFGYRSSPVAGQPTVVDGRVFVASAAGRVYALDAKSGCIYWIYDAQAGVRSAPVVGELSPHKVALAPKHAKGSKGKRLPAHQEVLKTPSAVFFGDDAGALYALNAVKGTLLWKTQVDGHPMARIQAAPVLHEGRLYVGVASSEGEAASADARYPCCTFRGSVAALDMADGRVLWKTHLVNETPRPLGKTAAGIQEFGPAGVAVLAAPTLDAGRNLLYVATGSAYGAAEPPLADAVVALDLNDGAVRWSRQLPIRGSSAAANGAAFDSAPILRTLAGGKSMIFATQRSGMVYALDPDRVGEVLWQSKPADGKSSGGIVWGAAADHRNLYAALSGLAADPPDGGGSLAAIDLKTGATRWHVAAPPAACSWPGNECVHAQAQAVTVIPGAAFSGSLDGHLRAYSTIDGKILWDYETAKPYATVNGIPASGGSLDQGGAVIVNGVVYVNSGYDQGRGHAGNVLLAFSVDGK